MALKTEEKILNLTDPSKIEKQFREKVGVFADAVTFGEDEFPADVRPFVFDGPIIPCQ